MTKLGTVASIRPISLADDVCPTHDSPVLYMTRHHMASKLANHAVCNDMILNLVPLQRRLNSVPHL